MFPLEEHPWSMDEREDQPGQNRADLLGESSQATPL